MVMRMVLDGTDMYVKFDMDPPEPGTEYWYLTDLAATGMDTTQLESPAGMGGPSDYLDSLRGAGADVRDAGRSEIDGVAVTRYEGTIDPQTAIDRAEPGSRDQIRSMMRQAGMEPIPFVALVDDDGLLRRQEMTMTMDVRGLSVSTRMTVDYYDFGADVTVEVPPADQVRPASDLSDLPA